MVDHHPKPSEYPEGFKDFIGLVPEDGLLQLFKIQLEQTLSFLKTIPEEKHDFSYAPDKWTIKQLIGHLCDGERTFNYRALCAARNDKRAFEGVDGQHYVKHALFERLTLAGLADEFAAIRNSSFFFFKHLPESAWDQTTEFPSGSLTVRALGYLLVAHERHHIIMIKNKYLKVDSTS